MGKWIRISCETCDETGKICDVCGGGTIDRDCEDDDDCDKCNDCVDCADCDGKGYRDEYIEECPECGGDGEVECDCAGGLGSYAADDDCLACGGSGVHTCPACKGTGWDSED